MKIPIPWDVMTQKGKEFLGRYKYVLLMIGAGLVFLLWPSGGGTETKPAAEAETAAESFSVRETEERLSEVLSKVHGAGEVTVMLAVQGDGRQVLAEDEASTQNGDGTGKVERSTVTLSAGSGSGEKAVVVQRLNPTYLGAVVVCEGGDNGKVKLKLMEAVASITGLGTDKITICKGKG